MTPDQPNQDPKKSPPEPRARWARLGSILSFELGLGGVAIVLAILLGIDLRAHWVIDLATLNWAILCTLPLLGLMFTLDSSDWTWVRVLNEPLEQHLKPIFEHLPRGGLFLVAMSAGLGEELLFRGVIQEGFSQWLGIPLGLILSALIFGLAHALNRYYVLVTVVIGLYLGLIYQASQNLALVILIHALYDWIILRYLLLGRRFQQRS